MLNRVWELARDGHGGSLHLVVMNLINQCVCFSHCKFHTVEMFLGSFAGWLSNSVDQLPATGSTEKMKKSFMAEMKAENIQQFLR